MEFDTAIKLVKRSYTTGRRWSKSEGVEFKCRPLLKLTHGGILTHGGKLDEARVELTDAVDGLLSAEPFVWEVQSRGEHLARMSVHVATGRQVSRSRIQRYHCIQLGLLRLDARKYKCCAVSWASQERRVSVKSRFLLTMIFLLFCSKHL